MARKDDYAWGKERPSARVRRLRRLADQTDLEIQAARTAYEKDVARIRAKKASLLQECDRIDRCLNARGEYDPVLAKAVAPEGWNSSEIPVKRPRGRPRTHFPGDPPRLRKSRAKAGGRTTRRSSARVRASIPPPVLTTDQIPTIATTEMLPRAAVVFLPTSAGLPANDNCLPEPEPAPPRKVAPKFDTYQGPDKALAYEEAQRRQKAAREDDFVEYERRANEIARAAQMRQRLSMPYDLSDPCDPSKMPEELSALYPHWSDAHKLPATVDPLDLPNNTLFEWIRVLVRDPDLAKGKQSDEDARKNLDNMYDGPRAFIKRYDHVSQEITIERHRREAWHWVSLRLFHVERLHAALQAECNPDTIRRELFEFDYQTEAALAEGYASDKLSERGKPTLRKAYVRIVDALQWPEHLSRREILQWARPDHDPDQLMDLSPFAHRDERILALSRSDKLRDKVM